MISGSGRSTTFDYSSVEAEGRRLSCWVAAADRGTEGTHRAVTWPCEYCCECCCECFCELPEGPQTLPPDGQRAQN